MLIPYLYKISFKENKSKFQFAFDIYEKIYAILSVYLTFVFFIFADEIILYSFGKKYLPAASVLRIVSFAIPPFFNIAANIMTALDKQKYLTQFQGICLIINIISNFVLIYFFKAEGAAFSTVLTYLFLYILSNRFLVKNKYVEYGNFLTVFFKLLLVILITGLLYYCLLTRMHFIFSFIILSVVYSSLTYIFLVSKEDIRIVREILGR